MTATTRHDAPARTVTVERIGPEAWESVRPLLRRHDPAVPEDRWRSLFHHPWTTADDDRGFVLMAGDRVAGYCGVVGSDRTIAGRTERVANITTWVVEPELRAHAMRLMAPVLAPADRTLTDLTPSPIVSRWAARWGFTPLESHVVAMAHVPGAPGRGLWVTDDPDEVTHVLRGESRRIAKDHLSVPGCTVLVVGDRRGTCLLVCSRITRGTAVPHAFVHHISDPELLHRHSLAVRGAVARACGVRMVLVDARMVAGRPPLSWRIALEVPRALRSTAAQPHQVDSLYSEMALLGLSTVRTPMPDPGSLRRLAATARARLRP